MTTLYGIGPDGRPRAVAVDADGKVQVTGIAGGGGGAGDASAANQVTLIERVTSFVPGATAILACSTTATAAVAVVAGAVVRFSNAGSAAIAVAFGSSGIAGTVAAATAIDILPGTAEAFTVPVGATHFSTRMASGTGALKYTIGTGA